MRKLLDAGVEVFAARGYHAARVDDVVKLAHTSHGTFYLYFANKEDLFRALMAEVAGQMQTLAEDLGPLTPGPAGSPRSRNGSAGSPMCTSTTGRSSGPGPRPRSGATSSAGWATTCSPGSRRC